MFDQMEAIYRQMPPRWTRSDRSVGASRIRRKDPGPRAAGVPKSYYGDFAKLFERAVDPLPEETSMRSSVGHAVIRIGYHVRSWTATRFASS